MVIYLQRKNELIIKITITLFLILCICGSSYLWNRLRVNNKDIVELEALKIENQKLKTEIEEYNKFKEINEEYIIGKVIIRNLHDFYNEIVIDLGSNQEINVGDAVLNEFGLIGIIYKTEENKSFARLISSNYNISVKINETYGNLNKGQITLLDKYSEIKVGDKVYTSGYSETPDGIYIGEIEEIKNDEVNLGQIAKIKLIDVTNLNYVSIIRSVK